MCTEDVVAYELRDGIAWMGLNRPHKRNAISGVSLAERAQKSASSKHADRFGAMLQRDFATNYA